MVDNTHMIDPVLLNFLEHAGLKPNDLGEEGLKRAKDMAEEHGLYQEYEQNASEGKKKRDKQRISMMPQPPKTPSGPPPMKPRQPPGPPPSRPPGGSPGSTVRRGPRGPPPSLPTRDPPKSRPSPGGGGGAGPPPPPSPPPPADDGTFPAHPGASSKPTPPRATKPGGEDLRESSVKAGSGTDVLQNALKTLRMEDAASKSRSDDDSDSVAATLTPKSENDK